MLRLEDIIKESLPVPPLPEGITERIMARARDNLTEKLERPLYWWPIKWVHGLSAPMKVAAVVSVILALFIGVSTDNLYGLEWFEPLPPSSITSVYISMAYEESMK